MINNSDIHDKIRERAAEYFSSSDAHEVQADMKIQQTRERHGLLPKTTNKKKEISSNEHEEEVNEFIQSRRTWRQHIPIARSFEYWRLRANFYPYIERSDAFDDFFIRGISCHPRLSEFPSCATVIRDYFLCRDHNKLLQVFNVCAPMKEQFCACINEIFVKNHKRGDKKFNETREQRFKEQRDHKFNKMVNAVMENMESKSKLHD